MAEPVHGTSHELIDAARGPGFICHWYGMTWGYDTADDRAYFLRAHLTDCPAEARKPETEARGG